VIFSGLSTVGLTAGIKVLILISMAIDLRFTKERVRAIREKLGLTQVEFADILEVSQPTVSIWESGDATPRGWIVLEALLKLEREAEAAVQ